MYVEAIAYLISTRTPLQGFFPLSTSQFYIWEKGKGIVRVQWVLQFHYAKLTDQRSVGTPEENGTTFSD